MTARNQASAVNALTLDLQVAVRKTRAEIDELVTMAGKGTLDSHDSDSSTGGSAQLVPIWRASTKRERGRQTFREPDSYPEPPAEMPEERRVEAQRAQREQG